MQKTATSKLKKGKAASKSDGGASTTKYDFMMPPNNAKSISTLPTFAADPYIYLATKQVGTNDNDQDVVTGANAIAVVKSIESQVKANTKASTGDTKPVWLFKDRAKRRYVPYMFRVQL